MTSEVLFKRFPFGGGCWVLLGWDAAVYMLGGDPVNLIEYF